MQPLEPPAVFAGVTIRVLLLTAAGIYAMMSFAVTQRRREIGIRLALGAGARTILWTMFSRAAAQVFAGAGVVSRSIKRRVREIVEWSRRRLRQHQAEKLAQHERIRGTPRSAETHPPEGELVRANF